MKYKDITTNIKHHPNTFIVLIECNGVISEHYVIAKSQENAEHKLSMTGWYINSTRNILGKAQ